MTHPLVVYFILWILSVSAAISYVCVIGFEMPIAHAERLLFTAFGMAKLPKVTITYAGKDNKEKKKIEKVEDKKRKACDNRMPEAQQVQNLGKDQC